jgi:cobalt-zinc-cadmium efflux system outer membrane protein
MLLRTPTFALAVLTACAAVSARPAVAGRDLTLADALAATLLHSPELDAASAAVREQEARALQAGLWPNPDLRLEAENIGGSGDFAGVESAESTLRLSQLVELGGKRAARVALAERQRDAAALDVELQRDAVLARTAQAFVGVLAAQAQVALAEDVRRQTEEAASAVGALTDAGAAPTTDAMRAGLVRDETELLRIRRDHELAAARAELDVQWAGAGPVYDRAAGDLSVIHPPQALPALLARLDANPSLARWGRELAAREANIDVQQARAIPDLLLTAGPRYFSDTDEVAAVVEVGLPLPLFDRAQGDIAEARARLAQGEAERRQADASLRSAVARAHAAQAAAYGQAVALRDRLLPAAEAARTASRDAYRRGALPLDELHDAQRALFDLRGREIEALAGYHQATAELERLLGSPIEEVQP